MRGFRKYKGYSDLVPTYCCSATPYYFVVFPIIGYEGYFKKWDVEVKGEGDKTCTKKSKSSPLKRQ